MMWRIVLLLVLLSSAIHGQVQIHFEMHQYTFPESSDVCVRIRHVGGPAATLFPVSYTFDAVLIRQTSGESQIATHLFPQGASTTELCLPSGGNRDNRVCERDTHGNIRLINSSAIRVIEPSMTSITITDDEFVFASFSQSSYTFHEDSGTQHMTLTIDSVLAKSINFHLTPDPELDASSPLTLLTKELFYESASLSAGIEVELREDVIALEQPQMMSLGILLSSSECHDLTIAPIHITILDDDVVMLGFTEEVVTVSESEGEAKLFVSISHIIARPLNFIIIHNSITTENQVKGGSVFGQLPAHTNYNSSEQCFTIPFLKDDIIGNDRHFFACLDIDERSYPTGVIIINPTVTVIIHDTSQCYDVHIDNSTERLIEVPPLNSVCFHCQFRNDSSLKSGDIVWKIGGVVLHPGVGEVLSDGSLQVTNSSSVFHKSSVAILSCSSREYGEEFTFPVLLQGGDHVHPIPTPDMSSSAVSTRMIHNVTILILTLHIAIISNIK